MKEIASQLIEAFCQHEELNIRIANLRSQMYNALSNANQDVFEIESYRISKSMPHRMKTYSRDRIAESLRSILQLEESQILDVLVAAQNETEVYGDVVVRRK